MSPKRDTTAEDRLLFLCTRQRFTDEHQTLLLEICRSHSIDWDCVYQTSFKHGVSSLVFQHLQPLAERHAVLPPHIVELFTNEVRRNTVLKEGAIGRAHDIIRVCNRERLPVMLVGSAALDVFVYDQRYYTHCWDVDLVIRRPWMKLTDAQRRELASLQYGEAIELDYMVHHDLTMNRMLPIDFDLIWKDATRLRERDLDYFIPCQEDLLISTCINTCRKRYRLKQVCDVAEIVARSHDLDWDKCIEKSRKDGCSDIVYSGLRVASSMLGCEVPEEVFRDLKIHPIRARAIDYLSHGALVSPCAQRPGFTLLGRRVDSSLVMPYLTYGPPMVLKSVRAAYLAQRLFPTTFHGLPR